MRGTVAHNVKEVTGYCTEYLVKLLCKSALLINKVFKFLANCTLGAAKPEIARVTIVTIVTIVMLVTLVMLVTTAASRLRGSYVPMVDARNDRYIGYPRG